MRAVTPTGSAAVARGPARLRDTVPLALPLLFALLIGLLAATGVQGQERLRLRCAAVEAGNEVLCARGAESAETLLARVGIALAGGNPVQGTASTFGIRLGSLPRIGTTLRVTAARIETARFGAGAPDGSASGTVPSFDFDVNVGLFSGFSPWATVGGLASIDLLGSVGVARTPDRFDGSPFGWALGARLGILRESFTAPGLSLSATYRRFGETSFDGGAVNYTVDGASMWSLRGAIGKRIGLFGLTGGVGYDLLSADAILNIDGPLSSSTLQDDDLEARRWTAFANAGWTFIIFSVTGEVGWQQGGDGEDGSPAANAFGAGAIYGGIALRIAI